MRNLKSRRRVKCNKIKIKIIKVRAVKVDNKVVHRVKRAAQVVKVIKVTAVVRVVAAVKKAAVNPVRRAVDNLALKAADPKVVDREAVNLVRKAVVHRAADKAGSPVRKVVPVVVSPAHRVLAEANNF
jgi:hypothetical protein